MNKTVNQIAKINDRIQALKTKLALEISAAEDKVRTLRSVELKKVSMKDQSTAFEYKVVLSFKDRKFVVTKDRKGYYVIKEGGRLVTKSFEGYENNVHGLRFAIAVGLV
jgi:hypothetical protein